MSERLSPKEIKRDIREDDVSVFLTRVLDRAYEQRRTLTGVAIGVVVALVAAFIAGQVFASRRTAANLRLVEALDTYQRPVAGDDTAAPGADDAFADQDERRSVSRQAFEQVGGGAAGDVANLYLAELALAEGDTEQARSLWQAFLDQRGDHLLGMSVRLNLFSLDRQEGRAQEVADTLRQELESSRKTLPEDVTLFELARTLDQLDQRAEAEELYQRLLDDHGASPYAAEVRERLGTTS